MLRQIAPILIWIPKNPAESPEGLSAEINQRLPGLAAPCRILPQLAMAVQSGPHLDLHRKDASAKSPMLRAPVA